MKSLISGLILLALLLSCPTAFAQQFQWVKGGGSTEDLSASLSTSESVQYMCTDPNGNVYALSIMGSAAPIIADTFSLSGGGWGNPHNIFISSYTCSGQMRWAKFLGSIEDSEPIGIVADSFGHIYLAGYFCQLGGNYHIGFDTVISPWTYLATGLIQFDTNGHFNWIKFVGTNSITSFSGVGYRGSVLTMDGMNNPHYLCYIKSHVPLMAGDTSVYGVYDLKYNSSGTLMSAVRLDLDSQWFLWGAVIDPTSNKLYVCGEINQDISGGTATDTFFAAAFDASRNLLWFHIAGHGTSDNALSSISYDQSKQLRFTGNGTSYFYFNGDSVLRTFSTYGMSVIMTTDTNGHPIRFRHFDCNTGVNGLSSSTVLSVSKIASCGGFAGMITDGTTTLTSSSGIWNPFLTIVNSVDTVMALKSLFGDGSANGTTAITSDKIDNIYIGGYVTDSIWAFNGATQIPAYHSIGGNTDFFIMKYGYECGCTSTPIASFSNSGIHYVKTFTYTGTTTGIDSIVWNFGDGHTGTGTPVAHTYTDTGTFHVCVTVYTNCGVDSVCSNVYVSSSVGSSLIAFTPQVKVYPNPVGDELVVEGMPLNSSYQLISIVGIVLQQGNSDETIRHVEKLSLNDYPAGMYFLKINNQNGYNTVVRITKQ